MITINASSKSLTSAANVLKDHAWISKFIIFLHMQKFSVVPHPAFKAFLLSIKDQKVRGAVVARIDRLGRGNAGDHAPVGGGLYELRVHLGAGWRIYYAQVGEQVLLLVGGGTKANQLQDIEVAKQRLDKYRDG